MATLSSHIIRLLYEHDCVIVPGLGAFLAQRVAARYDEQRALMFPPKREVLFNSQIRHTDGLLADTIANEDGVSFDEAAKLIDDFVSDVLRNVDLGMPVMLPEFGTFRIAGGVLTFEPVSGLNLLADSYGMAPVSAVSARPSINLNLSSVNVRRFAISAAVCMAFLLISPRTSDSTLVTADLSSSLSLFPNSPSASLDDDRFSVADGEALVDEAPVPVMKDFYCLVVASFSSNAEARSFISQMLSRGVSGLEIISYGGRERVITARFASKDEAVVANRDVRALAGFEKSWVLHVEDGASVD